MTKERFEKKTKENFCGTCAAGAALGAAIAGATGVKASETDKTEKTAGVSTRYLLWGVTAIVGVGVLAVLLLKGKKGGKRRRKR